MNTLFKHTVTGLVFNNRREAAKIMGASRYRKALKNCEFIFKYELQEGEHTVESIYSNGKSEK